ncbi:MAG: hypothetical protein MJ133_10185 [Lachnospiraceae bacterium]|nr:hypothetical protein [Lachnospiraceae bacterium]
MKKMMAFIKKEWMELKRGGKLVVSFIVFMLFAVLDAGIAKLTPVLFDLMADELADQGLNIIQTDVTAAQCWDQFNGNLLVLFIVFVIMFAGILVNEYQKGTLVLIVTKGMPRKGIYFAKLIMIVAVWTVNYAMMTALTWFYGDYYWDNSIMHHMFGAIMGIWLFGVMLCCLIMFFSTIVKGMSGVLLCIGGFAFTCSIIGFVPGVDKYLPTTLSDMMTVMRGGADISIPAIIICIVICVASTIGGNILIEKKVTL